LYPTCLALLALWRVAAAAAPGTEGMPPEVVAGIEAATDVPSAVLVDKAREGLAKGVPPERIALAIDTLVADMRGVDQLLGPLAQGSDREALLPAAAAAHRSGASDPSILRLSRLSSTHRAGAIRALADLVAQGFPEEACLRVIEGAAFNANPSEAIGGLASATAVLLAEGAPRGEVLEMVESGNHSAGAQGNGNGWGAGGSKDKDPTGKGLDHAPGQEGK
jgi:hypothetical protein